MAIDVGTSLAPSNRRVEIFTGEFEAFLWLGHPPQ
jgi:hypothetical protein